MAAIAGILSHDRVTVERMLARMRHRGPNWSEFIVTPSLTLGLAGNELEDASRQRFQRQRIAQDGDLPGRFARVRILKEGETPSIAPRGVLLERDPFGVAPLYYGYTSSGVLCFASEVKGLLEATQDIHELPPGYAFDGSTLQPYISLSPQEPMETPPEEIARQLRQALEEKISQAIDQGEALGAWLSGGIDSSAICALAVRKAPSLRTFAAGLPNAPDLTFARQVAEHLKTQHSEIIVQFEEVVDALPQVIYHLESFDAWLVRSSTLNYLATQYATNDVSAILSGEGGDELFAGYDYLKTLSLDELPDELLDILERLHNTALQRVDRCAQAHGVVPFVPFLDPDIVALALRIPARYKIRAGVEKWILRQAIADLLPTQVIRRPKAKFWQGSGIEERLKEYAEAQISDAEFERERGLPNGWLLNSKEELLYYRIFRQHFGELKNLNWMGRTKVTPGNL